MGERLFWSGRYQVAQMQQVVAGKRHLCVLFSPDQGVCETAVSSEIIKDLASHESAPSQCVPLQHTLSSWPLPPLGPGSQCLRARVLVVSGRFWGWRQPLPSSLSLPTGNEGMIPQLCTSHHFQRSQTRTFYGLFVDLEPRSNNNKPLVAALNVHKPVSMQGFHWMTVMIKWQKWFPPPWLNITL